MNLPLDIPALLKAATDIDEARIKANECAQNLRIVVNPAK